MPQNHFVFTETFYFLSEANQKMPNHTIPSLDSKGSLIGLNALLW